VSHNQWLRLASPEAELSLGMKDDLMDRVTEAFEPSTMPVALKYIAYGKLSEVSTWLLGQRPRISFPFP
jgi:YD repeat-containing protein